MHDIWLIYDAYNGAEEVDKYVIWLVVVSVLAELLVSAALGPGIVVRYDKKEE